MPGIFWRILIAVIAVALTFGLIPPVSRLIGLDINADMLVVIKLCVAGIAVFYIIKGKP